MHVLIPFAATLDPACRQALGALKLPQLRRLLATLAAGPVDAASEFSLTPAHERVQARCQGLPLQDGRAPFAAVAALGAATQLCPGVAADKQTHTPHGAWAFITPCHWVLGQNHVSMGDPDDLELSPQHSDQLRQSMQPYFAEDAIDLFPYQASTWLARSDFFSGLACASLDRVADRDVGDWLPRSPAAKLVRRLQSEMQMLLYTDPVNTVREGLGLQPINSFWVSGAGALPAGFVLPANQPSVDASLRRAALRRDASAYAQAWRELDAGRLADLNRELRSGKSVSLSLCGERSSITWTGPAKFSLSRWLGSLRRPSAQQALEAL